MPHQLDTLLATVHADELVLRIIQAQLAVKASRPNQFYAASRKVLCAYEIVINAHRRGGVNTNQMAELERIVSEIEGM